MQGLLIALVLAAAVLSRPIELRLWKAGYLSDRATTILVIGRLPAVVFLFSLIQGYSVVFTAVVTVLTLIVPALFFRYVMGVLRDVRDDRA